MADSLNERSVSIASPSYSKALDTLTPKGKLFRSRKLDYNRPLSIILEEQASIEDLSVGVMRSVPIVATGVDKEEEEEHHLKAILESAPTASMANVHIPIPELENNIYSEYEELYPANFNLPKNYFPSPPLQRILNPVNPFYYNLGNLDGTCGIFCQNNLLGFGFGAKSPLSLFPHLSSSVLSPAESFRFIPYGSSRIDEEFIEDIRGRYGLNSLNIDLFEKYIWVLESISLVFGWESIGVSFITTSDFKVFVKRWLLPEEVSVLTPVQEELFNYWKNSKIVTKGIPLIPTLKHEDNLKSATIDPYVCFRRREIRVARKTRRADMESVAKLRRLQEQFEDLTELLKLCLQRDMFKRGLLEEESSSFFGTLRLETWRIKFGITPPMITTDHQKTSKRKSKYQLQSLLSKEDSLFGVSSYSAQLFNLPGLSYDKLCEFLTLSGVFDPLSTISSWTSFFDPIAVSRYIDRELFDFESRFSTSFQGCYQLFQNQLAEERFFNSLSKHNSSTPSYRVGRGGRIFAGERHYNICSIARPLDLDDGMEIEGNKR